MKKLVKYLSIILIVFAIFKVTTYYNDNYGSNMACERCGMKFTKRIVYGYVPLEDIKKHTEKDYLLGGCIVSSKSPKYYCSLCNKKFGEFASLNK